MSATPQPRPELRAASVATLKAEPAALIVFTVLGLAVAAWVLLPRRA